MFASTILNYMDRQAVAVVGELITAEFRLSFETFGWVIAAFQLSYAFCQVPAGYLVDKLDLRWSYAGAVLWWSAAAIAVSFAPTLGILLAARALLGIGESFNWPCALKVTERVLPPADRGLGNGIFNSGAAAGAVLTPLIVTPLTHRYGWRVAFAVIGLVGFLWVGLWILLTAGRRAHLARPSKKVAGTESEIDVPAARASRLALASFGGLAAVAAVFSVAGYRYLGLSALFLTIALLMIGVLVVARVLPMSSLAGAEWTASLGEIVRLRRFWILVIVSISVNVCWHFLVNWLPTYLKTDRGMTFVAGSLLSAVPFIAADAGNIGGGWLSRWIARMGVSPESARLIVVAGCSILISGGAWVGGLRDNTQVLVLLAVMAFGTAAFMANYFAYCQEVCARRTGLIVGVLGGIGNLAAAGFAPIAGHIKDVSGGFGPVFAFVGLLPFVGVLALWLGWRSSTERADST